MFRVDPDQPFKGPHQGEGVLTSGEKLTKADAAMILIHGRGASAQSILGLAEQLDSPGLHYIAPMAANHTWYPWSFLKPIEMNQPGLNSALQVVQDLLTELEQKGIPRERTILAGFSQGACIVSEFAARHPMRYAGVAALSGGLIGEKLDKSLYQGSLERTPVFIGCSDVDPHIPLSRVEEGAGVFEQLGAELDKRIYPGMGHTVNDDELNSIRSIISKLNPGKQ